MTDHPARSWTARAVALLLLLAAAVVVGCGDDKKDKVAKDKKWSDKGKDVSAKDKVARGPRDADVDDEPDHRTRYKDAAKATDKAKDKGAAPRPVANDDEGEAKPKGRAEARDGESVLDPQTGKDKGKDKPRAPQVWHRDAARKTFARVYVGDGNSLELVSLHVSVVVEGPRVRTLVDHVFRNPHDRTLEGTFEYPLPAGASPSYYAMFLGASRDEPPARFKPRRPVEGQKVLDVASMAPAELARQVDVADWGKLQEAKVVAPEKALEAYEEVVRGRVDPALLEYASGNTFRGRVFPIQPKGYNRVILAYEETLPVSQGKQHYRFDLPGCKLHEMRFSLQFDPREGKDPAFFPKEARKEAGDERTAFSHSWSDTKPEGAVTFSLTPKDAAVQAASGRHGDKGPLYLYARLRPELPKVEKEKPFSAHAVFLLDTSLSESPDRFAVSMKLLQAILEADDAIKHFNVLCFNAGAAWVGPKGWLANTKEGREKALAKLDGILLEGATDLSAALEKLVSPDWSIPRDTPLSCFLLSDGHLTWGETEAAPLVARFRKRCANPVRFFCYRTGLGEENAELYDALTRDGGGVFQCFGEAEVKAAAGAHRRQCLSITRVKYEGAGALSELLVGGRRSAVYPGGELVVTGHAAKAGKGKLVLEGEFAGKAFTQSFAVDVADGGELAPRGWGEVAVASLLALNDPWLEPLVTAYCQQFNIASRSASFLVLEDEADYKRMNLEDEKKRALEGDLDRYLDSSWALLGRDVSLKQMFGRLLTQIDSRTGVLGGDNSPVMKMLSLLGEGDCALPPAFVKGGILKEKEASGDYLSALSKDRRNIHAYVAESQRRHNDGDADAAVRALSGVVEEYAGRGDALRLVGYRLLDLREPSQASWLFARVLRQRPFEPHSFRDFARSLEESGRYALAALMYESVLAGKWHNRFGEALKTVTREDHVRLLRLGLREGQLTKDQRAFFEKRLDALAGSEPASDLRVSIAWNTDATDIDLHVIEPDGFKVYYGSAKSPSGGALSTDQTQGYGPERYHIRTARKGEYRVLVHYFRANRNLLGGETHVSVTVTRNAGKANEKVERHTVILRREGELSLVARVKF